MSTEEIKARMLETFMDAFNNGKIAEIWHQEDLVSLMQQIEVIPVTRAATKLKAADD